MAQAVTRADKGFAITTVSGREVRPGRRPRSPSSTSPPGRSSSSPTSSRSPWRNPEPIRSTYQRDKNLDKRPIQLMTDPAIGKKETFPKGLTLHAKTMITYELKGQYKVVPGDGRRGRGPGNGPPSHVKITIDDAAAGANLFKGSIKKGDKPVDLNLNVQNVDRLRITVESEGTVTDLGNQVSLANARVLK